MINAAAGITLYNPDIPLLARNINHIYPQIHHLYFIDNGSDNIDEIKNLIDNYDNTTLVQNKTNLGVAKALNQMCELAYNSHYDWILTLDQDSVCNTDLIEKYIPFTNNNQVAILTPHSNDENETDVVESYSKKSCEIVHRCITSGSFTRLSTWKEVNGFDENMFIDCVDFDYCTTVEEHGYTILRINNAILNHRLGKAKEVKAFMPLGRLLGMKKLMKPFYTYGHSALRTYYYARNIKYYSYKHRNTINKCTERRVYFKWLVLKLGFEKDKFNKFKAIIHGRLDANKMIKSYKEESIKNQGIY